MDLLFTKRGMYICARTNNNSRTYSKESIMEQIFLACVVLFVVFIVLGEVNCWYWKINEGVAVLKEIRELLKGVE